MQRSISCVTRRSTWRVFVLFSFFCSLILGSLVLAEERDQGLLAAKQEDASVTAKQKPWWQVWDDSSSRKEGRSEKAPAPVMAKVEKPKPPTVASMFGSGTSADKSSAAAKGETKMDSKKSPSWWPFGKQKDKVEGVSETVRGANADLSNRANRPAGPGGSMDPMSPKAAQIPVPTRRNMPEPFGGPGSIPKGATDPNWVPGPLSPTDMDGLPPVGSRGMDPQAEAKFKAFLESHPELKERLKQKPAAPSSVPDKPVFPVYKDEISTKTEGASSPFAGLEGMPNPMDREKFQKWLDEHPDIKERFEQRRADREKENLKQFDKNQDGKIDSEEREAQVLVLKERQREMLEKRKKEIEERLARLDQESPKSASVKPAPARAAQSSEVPPEPKR